MRALISSVCAGDINEAEASLEELERLNAENLMRKWYWRQWCKWRAQRMQIRLEGASILEPGQQEEADTQNSQLLMPTQEGTRFHIIRNACIDNVGKYQSCMVSKLRIIWKQTVPAASRSRAAFSAISSAVLLRRSSSS